MTDQQKFRLGYRYAQQENAALAGVYPEPDDPRWMAVDPSWQRGYERFREEQDRAP